MNQITVPLLDLKAQYATIKAQIERAVLDVLDSQWFILGPNVQECERRIAEYCHCPHAVGVSSGSDALLISLMAEGIGPGDEVITTPYTFFATVGCISRVGAKPVLVDICPKTYNIDPNGIEDKVTPKTKAIIPVHLFGQCAEMDPILDIAQRHGLVVIEDAAQAIGAEYWGHEKGVGNLLPERPEGCFAQKVPDTFFARRAGSMGHYGCFSFFPSKNLGAAGDGGMVTTNDEARADRLRSLRNHGSKPKYYHKFVGGNFRLDALQAAIVLVKLDYLDGWTAARQQNAQRYAELFKESGLLDSAIVTLPQLPSPSPTPDTRHLTPSSIYNQFVIRVPRRDELKAYLKDHGVATEIYYPVPMHLQQCFANLGYKAGDMPESEKAAAETLALPIYPELTDQQQRYVVESIAQFYADT